MLSEHNIASHLTRLAAEKPYKIALYEPFKKDSEGCYSYIHYTYKKLEDESNIIARGLEAYNISKDSKTVLMVTPSLEFFALTFALFKIGAVPVLIDPGMGLKNMKQCLKEATPDAFIGSPKAHIARIVLGWERGKIKNLITVGEKSFCGGTTLEEIKVIGKNSKIKPFSDTKPSDIAAILFTSGSTGTPKGAVYMHSNFQAQVEALKREYNIGEGDIDLCTFPLFALFAPAMNMVAIIPKMDFTRPAKVDPAHIFDIIESFGVTNLFGSPALIRRVSKAGKKLPTLRRVISAGAPVPAKTLREFSKMLAEDTQIFTPYGATEALPVSSIGSHEILSETAGATDEGKGICIGRPLDSINASIIKITDDPIEEWTDDLLVKDGQIGEITVEGPQVTTQYINRNNSNRLNKIKDPKTNKIHHRMGDVGYKDQDGRIWFCGRKSHRVKTETGTLFTIQVEAIFNIHEDVSRSALVGIPDRKLQKPVLIVETEKKLGTRQLNELRGELLDLASKNELTRSINTILFHTNFPVDIRHNAKISRETLSIWAEKRLL
ncbi:AMP-binding protein [bacterium]|nr:AMP-binding protein [bacterium]